MHIHLDAHMHFHKHIKPGQRRRPKPAPADADRRHDQQLMGLAGRFARRVRESASGARASRDRLRRRRTPTRHHRGTPARTAWDGHVGDPAGPGADDGVAAESVQCRPGHSPGRAVDVCTVTPQASRCGGWRGSVHKCAPPGCWGSSPEVVTRLAGTLDRFTSMLERLRSDSRPTAYSTRYRHLSQICAPVSAGSMPTVTASASPSGYNAAGSAIRAAAGVVHRGGANSAADGSAPGAAVTPSPQIGRAHV